MRRSAIPGAVLAAVLLLSAVSGVVAGAGVGGAQAAAGELSPDAGAEPALSLQEDNGTDANATATPSLPEDGSTGPNSSSQARITPVQFEEGWLSVDTRERDAAYNTSGPFVILSITEELEAVRISQSSAEARLLEGEQTVRVDYAKDAAPDPEQPSLYTLELFYADGSKGSVQLYATKTDVSVDAAALEEFRPLFFKMRDDASDAGYERDADGVEAFYENTKERADLLDSLFVEKAFQAAATAFSWFSNPVSIGLTVLLLAIGSYYRYSRRGYALDVISNGGSRAQRQREQLFLNYRKAQQTADEERLRELPNIGETSEIYWRDAQGASTVYQLAELARSGKMVRRDGEVRQQHTGISELRAGELEDSWLESVAGTGRNRIASYDIALSHLKTALERMNSTYGMGHIYRETYEEVVELIDARQELIHQGQITTTRSSGSGAPSGD